MAIPGLSEYFGKPKLGTGSSTIKASDAIGSTPVASIPKTGGYDIFAGQTANMQQDFNNSIPKAYEPTPVNGNVDNFYNKSGSTVDTGPGWFGEGGYLSTGANVAQGLAGLMGAYTGWEQLGLAEDQFDFEKEATNRNLETQGQMVNTAYQNAGDVGLALAGGSLSPEQRAAEQAKIRAKYIDTSKIG